MARPRPPVLGAVTFDLWYTVWYQHVPERAAFRRSKHRAWEKGLLEVGVPLREARRILLRLDAERARRVGRGWAWPIPDQVAWLRRAEGTSLELGRLIERLDRAVAHASLHVTPGLRHLLRGLHGQGIRTGLVTNVLTETPGATRARLAAEHLAEEFGAIAISSEVGRSKPDPLPYRVCLEALRVPAARALHFGDLPTDVEGAWAAGTRAYMYVGADRWGLQVDRTSRATRGATYPRVRSWTDAERLLAALRAGGR